MDFSTLIKNKRSDLYLTAKEFHTKSSLSCTYSHYSLIENGKAIPKIDLALEILNVFDIDQRKGMYAWVRSTMPDAKTKQYFTDLDDSPTVSETFASNENSMVLNRAQGRLLRRNPIYWELILFINCTQNVSVETISDEFGLPVESLSILVQELYDNGFLELDDNGLFYSTNRIYLPQKQEFHDVRDMNFKRSLYQFMEQKDGNKYRSTVTIKLTEDQAKEVERRALEFGVWLMNIEKKTEGSKIFTFGVFFSERKFGETI